MSLESKIDDLIAALDANTKALLGKPPKDEPAKEEPKAEGRSRRSAREEPKSDGPTEAELKAAVAKFLDQPEGKDGDAEYEKRLEKVIDPMFEKAKVKELADLPEKFWPDLLDGIAEYGKAAEGGGRRSRR